VAEPLELSRSAGLFYDRDGSLICSLIINGTDEMAARLNVYPGLVPGLDPSAGFFAGLDDEGSFMIGISIRQFPIGLLGATQ
jgi:hypothetical protein